MALVATSLDGPAFSCLTGLCEADTQDWSSFTVNLPEQIDSGTAQFKTQAETQKAYLNTHESFFILALLKPM